MVGVVGSAAAVTGHGPGEVAVIAGIDVPATGMGTAQSGCGHDRDGDAVAERGRFDEFAELPWGGMVAAAVDALLDNIGKAGARDSVGGGLACSLLLTLRAMIPTLLEIMPEKIRTAGFSLAFSLNTVVFGGFTPAIATFAIQATGSRAAPAIWLSFAAGISLTAALLEKRNSSPLNMGVTPAVAARVAVQHPRT